MTFSRARLAVALTMAVAAAAASPLTLSGTARADDTQSGAQSGTQSGSSWVPGTTLSLANSKSVEALSMNASTLTFASSTSEQTKIYVLSRDSSDATGALIEQKDATGKVTSVSGESTSTPSPILWWTIGGGAVLLLFAAGAAFLRRRR